MSEYTNSALWFVCSLFVSFLFTHYAFYKYLGIYEEISMTYQHKNKSVPYFNSSSSVWCNADKSEHKTCKFQNICYSPPTSQFLFILTSESVISGIENADDLKTIEMSSVANHTQFFMSLAIVTRNSTLLKRKVMLHKSVFVISRFKPDNIMHVFHDDLIPLYFTYSHLCAGDVNECVKQNRLVYTDKSHLDPFADLYRIFSNSDPLYLSQQLENVTICFDEAYVGVLRNTLWFQYGFGSPQGPIHNNYFVPNVIKSFSQYIIKELNITPSNHGRNKACGTLFSRKKTRKIMNEDYLIGAMRSAYNSVYSDQKDFNVIVVDFSSDSLKSIISILLSCNFIVGMHGAGMVLSLFLKPGSLLVELFPYGIDPENVSFLKALYSKSEYGIFYHSWRNVNVNNSVVHPEADPLLGGIAHLPKEEQEKILKTTNVPAVYCCHDPAYLYRMFQDTIVDDSIVEVFQHCLRSQKHFSSTLYEINETQLVLQKWFFPSRVTHITCHNLERDNLVAVQWVPSVNSDIASDLYYEVVVKIDGDFEQLFKVRKPKIMFELPPISGQKILKVWVQSVVGKRKSSDEYHECLL